MQSETRYNPAAEAANVANLNRMDAVHNQTTTAPRISRAAFTSFTVGLPIAFLLAAVGARYLLTNNGLTDLASVSPPLYLPADADRSGRVILLTSQWRTTITFSRTPTNATSRTSLMVDLWAIDDRDGHTLWRRRLESIRDGSIHGRWMLGAEGDTIWILRDDAIEGYSAQSGDRIVNAGQVEATNPSLSGLMPTELRYYSVDSHGLRILAGDGRAWYVDGETLVARSEADAGTHEVNAYVPAFFTPSATKLFQVRGLDVPGRWLGMLTVEEAEAFERAQSVPGMDEETRRRLWGAQAAPPSEGGGPNPVYSDFEPLPASPDFLGGGLLCPFESGAHVPALWLRDPDSVLVLHHDRLGAEGALRLARLAGPDGRVVWDTILPLTVLQSVIVPEEGLILFGQRAEGDSNPERLVFVDLETGALKVHDHSANGAHIEAVPL